LKQFIRPPLMARIPATNEWLAPSARSGARVSLTSAPLHVRPWRAPSAPGKVPNIVSNVRFSFTTNTTCLMACRASWSWEGGFDGDA